MGKKKNTQEEIVETKKSNNTFKHILIFILFLGIGIAIGYFGASKYLETKNDDDITEPVVDSDIMDITEDENSAELIKKLLSTLDGNPMFYSTRGISVSTMDNTSKLTLIYNYIIKNNLATSEELTSTYVGSTTCLNSFITDVGDNASLSTNKCTVYRINKSVFLETSKLMFNDEILDTSVLFNPSSDKTCVVDGETYLCGNVLNTTGVTGALESVFSVEKVTKDLDNTILIYEKGYLNDKRSTTNNPNDQYDNYYLHSSDSTDYYYELKSADNLTFKHTFKTKDGMNYYYVSTELHKE